MASIMQNLQCNAKDYLYLSGVHEHKNDFGKLT